MADLFNREGENRLCEHPAHKQGRTADRGIMHTLANAVYKHAEQHGRDQRPWRSRTAGKT